MNLSGKSLIAGQWLAPENAKQYQAYNPELNEHFGTVFLSAEPVQLEQAVDAAKQAYISFAQLKKEQRAILLDQIAEQILLLGDELIELTMQETALPRARLEGERMRTVNQLRLFASTLREPIENTLVDDADPARTPLPKPKTELHHIAVGPVAVFGASNFPYAFSVAGGDTASALAAGCPVIVKAHTAHPGTSELVALAISRALDICQLPQGIFSLIQSKDRQLSHDLVKHPSVKAVGFTGSYHVGMLLHASIKERKELIPFYGELGSVNPQLVLPQKMAGEGMELAKGLVNSMMLGQGQMCTSPGIWLVPENKHAFEATVKTEIESQISGALLSPSIASSYEQAISQLMANSDVELIGRGQLLRPHHAQAHIFKTDMDTFLSSKNLHEEVFGPCALIVTYSDVEQLSEFTDHIEGQLTASIHAETDELQSQQALVFKVANKVGRLIFNQMPTGVEVCHSMNHGGPFPSSTDVRSTSVGTQAMKRFERPICLQNSPYNIL